MTREDVMRIVEGMLKDLVLETKDGDFTNPNQRIVVLKYMGKELAKTTFDVVQKREYEG